VMNLARNYIVDIILHHRSKWCEHVERMEGDVCWKTSTVVG
jgi:hypothetical protein